MNQIAKEYSLTLLALLALPGGTIFSLVFFRPANIFWQSTDGIMAFLGISTSAVVYLVLLDKRNRSIDNRIKISFPC